MLLAERIPVSYVLKKVRYDLVYLLIVTLAAAYFTNTYKDLYPQLPLTIPVFIGTAISILLSFKLSQSYDRWWEARKIWGAIVNDSRSLVVQLHSLAAAGNDEIIKKIGYRQIAWCYSLGQTLRGLDPMINLSEFLTPEELAEIEKHQNKPLALLDLHGKDLKFLKDKGQIDSFAHVQLNQMLVRLCDWQGMAERIKSTIFPATYRIFLHYIIYLFVITLSISLRGAGYFEIPLLILISIAFFLLEKSATYMQDPFENRPSDTAMTTISRTIEINIKQLLNDKNVPEPLPAFKFYRL